MYVSCSFRRIAYPIAPKYHRILEDAELHHLRPFSDDFYAMMGVCLSSALTLSQVHVLVIPKRLVQRYEQLTSDEVADLMISTQQYDQM